jgi:hypothetical protein
MDRRELPDRHKRPPELGRHCQGRKPQSTPPTHFANRSESGSWKSTDRTQANPKHGQPPDHDGCYSKRRLS